MKNIRAAFLLIPGLFMYCCTNTSQLNAQTPQDLTKCEILAKEKYKTNYSMDFNSDSTFVLVKEIIQTSPAHPQHTINYFIYDIKENKLLYEDSIPDGKVNWYNNHQVLITSLLGNITGDSNEIKNQKLIFNVLSKKIKPFVAGEN